MAASQTLLKSARLFHLYSGVFFAPALLFFAFTGAVQSFNFHETTRGSNYKPPAILAKLAQLHKKETLDVPERKGTPPPGKPGTPDAPATTPVSTTQPAFDPTHLGDHTNQQKHDRLDHKEDPQPVPIAEPPALSPKASASPPRKTPNTLPMKIFSFWTGVGLFLSTLTGLYMSYRYTRRSLPITLTLLAGIALPAVLLLLQ